MCIRDRDPSEANRSALRKQVGINYDKVLDRKRRSLDVYKRQVTMCALMWMLPNNYPREPCENIIMVLLGALFIFLFFVFPVWMIISAIRDWKTKDYIRATVAVLISLAILENVLFGPCLLYTSRCV